MCAFRFWCKHIVVEICYIYELWILVILTELFDL